MAPAPVWDNTGPAQARAQRHFEPMRAPGYQLAEDEILAQLSKFDYNPRSYGIKWRSAGLVEYVFQPWYQDLLDMGSIQVTHDMHASAVHHKVRHGSGNTRPACISSPTYI